MKIYITVLLFCLFSSTTGCALFHHYGPHQGKVIDSESQEPLEGVAVLAIYNTQSYGPGGSISHYVDVRETLTDKKGEFYIPSFTSLAFRPLQSFEPYVWFWMFKSSYGCYPNYKGVKPMFLPNGSLPQAKQVIIELPKIKTKEERLKNLGCEPVVIPPSLYPRYLHIINSERTGLGLDIVPVK